MQMLKSYAIQHFESATEPDLFSQAMLVRTEVFIEEQQVPENEERDHYDEEAVHWLAKDAETGEPVATARMLTYQEVCQAKPVAKIGRVAVRKSCRGTGLGKRIMEAILTYCYSEGFEQAILDSQTHAMPFYAALGFEKEGFEFMDAGIPHYRMRKVLR